MQSIVELKVIAVVIMKITVFQDATSCSVVELVYVLEKLAASVTQ